VASSTPWSMPVAATFIVTVPPLLMTEIMYHPKPAPAGSTNSASDFEFIELKNTGLSSLSLVGFRLTNGIDFVFTATNGVTNLAPGGGCAVGASPCFPLNAPMENIEALRRCTFECGVYSIGSQEAG